MASTFKTLLNDDVTTTRTLLHEAIPITGTIVSGTYKNGDTDTNVKTFSHGMFKSVYDYPYLSSSANHIMDITYGHSQEVSSASDWMTQNGKKLNIYNQMAQVLLGYDHTGSIRKFHSDGIDETSSKVNQMDQCFFINFSRLLVKDEIKKGSFTLKAYSEGYIPLTGSSEFRGIRTLGDYASLTEYRTSPAGDYGLLFTSSADATTTDENYQQRSFGLIFYQAGIAVVSASLFMSASTPAGGTRQFGDYDMADAAKANVRAAAYSGTIEQLADAFRMRLDNIDFNNTIELNSTIYFARVNHNEFNYSSNPTYVSGSKLAVKNNTNDLPITYITTVGLYSSDNELLAVAKLSEPIRKDPNTELTLRVRLDY